MKSIIIILLGVCLVANALENTPIENSSEDNEDVSPVDPIEDPDTPEEPVSP